VFLINLFIYSSFSILSFYIWPFCFSLLKNSIGTEIFATGSGVRSCGFPAAASRWAAGGGWPHLPSMRQVGNRIRRAPGLQAFLILKDSFFRLSQGQLRTDSYCERKEGERTESLGRLKFLQLSIRERLATEEEKEKKKRVQGWAADPMVVCSTH